MTAGNHGSGTPQDDDPFAYLYRPEGGAEGAATQRPGVPRASYNQVRAVGERRYGGQQLPQQQTAPDAHYAAPETVSGGRAAGRRGGHGGGRGAGRSHNGLLIGALAVVAAVVLGVGAAVVFSDFDGGASQPQAVGSEGPVRSGSGSDDADGEGAQDRKKKEEPDLPAEDAAALRLLGGAQVADDIPGAQSRNGAYVTGFTTPGASAGWTFDVPEGGAYTLHVGYGVPGEDADATLTVNGKAMSRPLNMKNFAGAEKGDWESGWTRTYAYVDLNEGTNTTEISCEQGNRCEFVLDRVWLEKGHTGS